MLAPEDCAVAVRLNPDPVEIGFIIQVLVEVWLACKLEITVQSLTTLNQSPTS